MLRMSPVSTPRRPVVLAVVALIILLPSWASGQNNNNTTQRAVGGVSIDASGLLSNASLDTAGQLRELRLKGLQKISGDLNQPAGLRKVSLRGLEAAIVDHLEKRQPLSDAMKYLAGLQQIQYVLVYPEQRDLVLVGPGEGWTIDSHGIVVGVASGRPVLLLDDLLVALRTARQAAQGGITCSIDPTKDGLTRLNALQSGIRRGADPQGLAANIENAMGEQTITIQGVPGTTHFARVLVAADYRMKRLAMGFDRSPLRGLPNFLQMVPGGKVSMIFPRWWLAPNYAGVVRSPDGLAWELRGAAVKAMTEEEYVSAAGERERSGKANPLAQKWADNMTAHYNELSVVEPIFGQLRNCMDLAIVSALIVKENLADKAGYSMPLLLDASRVETDQFAAPKQVATQVSMLKKGNTWIMSASGGVQIDSWGAVQRVEQSDAPATVRAKTAHTADNWWWN